MTNLHSKSVAFAGVAESTQQLEIPQFVGTDRADCFDVIDLRAEQFLRRSEIRLVRVQMRKRDRFDIKPNVAVPTHWAMSPY
ncbi:hypothetical protein [Solirubrobacter soli]|uniref:hypothetical protein n=1 Tax=Solirubrobacter soli TaxID=363832 RepID=UPI0004848513|nr:hypothetical protein [Solirubrobacter soli]